MQTAKSFWTVELASVGGIPVRIHLTFFLLLAWVFLTELQRKSGAPLIELVFVVCLFACVLLHELGHALMARTFKVRTRDITLYPFGGIASLLDETPPRAEFFITIAGPLVNVVIALLLFPLVDGALLDPLAPEPNLLTRLFAANVILVIFNLIPAFPMDGGRLFRSALALLGVKKATPIATRTSQVISVLMAILAFYIGHIWLLVIATLVFVTAAQELLRDKARGVAAGFRVLDATLPLTQLQMLKPGTSLSSALSLALRSLQTVFPVSHGENLIGVVMRDDLIDAAARSGEEIYVSSLANRNLPVIDDEAPLEQAGELFSEQNSSVILVRHDKAIVGLLLRDGLYEFLLVHGLRKQAKDIASREDELDW